MTRNDWRTVAVVTATIAVMMAFMPRHPAPPCSGAVDTLFGNCRPGTVDNFGDKH